MEINSKNQATFNQVRTPSIKILLICCLYLNLITKSNGMQGKSSHIANRRWVSYHGKLVEQTDYVEPSSSSSSSSSSSISGYLKRVRRSQLRPGSADLETGDDSMDPSTNIVPLPQYHASSSRSNEPEKVLRPEKCIPIEISLCKNIGYNLTYMPNAFNHETQEEAGLEVHQFYPLVEINCSEDLRLFLCSLYTPICLPNWHYRLTACRSLCESARAGCMPVMRSYGFGWPERMNCDLLPEGSECVSRSNTPASTQSSSSSSGSGTKSGHQQSQHSLGGSGHPDDINNLDSRLDLQESNQLRNSKSFHKNFSFPSVLPSEILMQLQEHLTGQLHETIPKHNRKPTGPTESNPRTNQIQKPKPGGPVICLPCRCRDPFISWVRPPYNEVITGGVVGCLPSCRNPTFNNQSDKTFATFWLGLWAVLCALSCLATVATFLADPGRFQYPERPIIYLSACYFMVALGYLMRVGMGHEVIACDGPVLRRGSTGSAQCSIVFLLTYVFGMSSSVWWVVLTLTWFLAAGLKWGSEAIAKYSQIYHFFAWFFPGTQAIFILILSAVDGDPIGGLCFVGSTNLNYLRLFVLAPMCLYLSLGTIFLLAGFVALFKIRSAIKLQARGHLKTDKLEKLMIRIGIFGVLYTVPATVVIACLCYELRNRELWERAHNCPCAPIPTMKDISPDNVLEKLKSLLPTTYPFQKQTLKTDQRKDSLMLHLETPNYMHAQPEYAIFMLKYFMSLVVGITSGFWIWSSKTLDSWQYCLRRAMGRPSGLVNKRGTLMVNGTGLMTQTGNLMPNRSPPPPPPPSIGQSGQPGSNWNATQSKLWLATNSGPLLTGSSCKTWQDDFNSNSRLLPQPPSVNLTCSHSMAMHLNPSGNLQGNVIALNNPPASYSCTTGSVSGGGGGALAMITCPAGNPPGSGSGHDMGTNSTGSAGTLTPGPLHSSNGRAVDPANLLLLQSTSISHI